MKSIVSSLALLFLLLGCNSEQNKESGVVENEHSDEIEKVDFVAVDEKSFENTMSYPMN